MKVWNGGADGAWVAGPTPADYDHAVRVALPLAAGDAVLTTGNAAEGERR
eukprot:gene3102-7416_t